MLFMVSPPAYGQNRGIIAGMTNLQLALSIGIPSLLVLVGIFLNNARFGAIDNRFTSVEGRIDRMGTELNGRIDRMDTELNGRIDKMDTELNGRIDKMGSDLNARLDRQQADLSQFYMILGRHEADINNLKEQRRSA